MQEKLGPRLEQARPGRRQVYFVDAAHFVFAPFLGCLWCAARLFVRAASGRKRYNVLGALDAVTHRLVRVTNHDYINAESVCALLRAVAAASVGLPITLVLDNARYQKCAVVQALASSLGIELLYLPGYSPNLNLIERLWRFVRKQSLDSIYYEDFAIHGCDRSVPGRSAHSTQGRDGNSNDSQVPDVWRCATIGRVEYNAGVAPCYPGGFPAVTLKDSKGGIVAVLVDENFDLRGLKPGPSDPDPERVRATERDVELGMVQKGCVLGNILGPSAWGPFWLIPLSHKELRQRPAAPRVLPCHEPGLELTAGLIAPATQPGTYDVFVPVGLRDGTPWIALPLSGDDGQRRYRLGGIRLLEERPHRS